MKNEVIYDCLSAFQAINPAGILEFQISFEATFGKIQLVDNTLFILPDSHFVGQCSFGARHHGIR